MFMHVQRMINEIVADEPDPAAANALQEGLGGQFGEMRTMMQYLFQAFNFRGATGKPYKDLLYGVGTEEIGHVELIATTIARLTDGSPQSQGSPTKPVDEPGKGGATPLASALSAAARTPASIGPREPRDATSQTQISTPTTPPKLKMAKPRLAYATSTPCTVSIVGSQPKTR